ncbi:FUSC family protein [Xanthobacter dioxanivorans]|uniref:FUSC family protein n=1 Tax=Xanthobacter dioxanivorans TaxID=2528964 RepID=A0A974PLS6_9HYPH|nr:FUSC family protein [Xanthobacter dioxanivorans]QRG05940.1 FUSC family protein [Xanthobacter dioxanivorans]
MAGSPPGWSARQGALTASSVVLAVLVGAALGLQDMWWAAISAWVVANPDFGALWRKAVMRVVGTMAGLALGYALAIVMEGRVAFQALALFAACALGSYQRFASRYGYAWFYGTITIMLMVTVSIVEPRVLFSFAQFRFVEIACGVLASAFVHALARPPAPAHAAVAPAAAHAPDLDLTRLALVGGLSAVGMTAIWSWFDIPSLPQAIASALVVLDRDFAAIRARARQRFLGCALGAALGVAALSLDLDALPLYGAVLFAGIFYFSRLHHGGGSQSYIGTQGGVAFITAMVTGSGPPAALLPVVERLAGIFVGVLLMVGVSVVLAAVLRRKLPATP